MEEHSSVREANLSKSLCKIMLYSIKVIPMIISGIYILNTVLSYFDIDLPILSYIVQYLFILITLIASLAFRFCKWHRIFIYYIAVILTLNIIDYHIGIPVSDRCLYLLYGIITGVFLFIILYLRFKICRN